MGVGYVICVSRKDSATALNALEKAKARPMVVGEIQEGSGITRFA